METESFLLYVSQAPKSQNGQGYEALRRKMLEHPMPAGDVTGVLVYRNGYFMQYLEGQELSVAELFWNIRGIKNHYNIRVLSRGRLSRRRFSNWSIKVVSISGPSSSSESLIELFETVLLTKSSSENEIDAVLKRFCKDSVVFALDQGGSLVF